MEEMGENWCRLEMREDICKIWMRLEGGQREEDGGDWKGWLGLEGPKRR